MNEDSSETTESIDKEENGDVTTGAVSDNSNGQHVRIPKWIQLTWVIVAALLLIAHAYEGKDAAFPLHPIVDAVTIAAFVLILLGLTLNYLSEIGLPGGGKLVLRKYDNARKAFEGERQSARALRLAVERYSEHLQSWTNSVNLLSEHLKLYGTSDTSIDQIISRYVLERMEEARQLIGEADDRVRISVWWYFEEFGGLRLLYADGFPSDSAAWNHVFKPMQGLCGQCYVEGRYYNLEIAADSAYYERIEAQPPDYAGLMCIPMREGVGRIRGVLCMDRKRAEKFEDVAVNAAYALSDLVVFALTHPKTGGAYLDAAAVGP